MTDHLASPEPTILPGDMVDQWYNADCFDPNDKWAGFQARSAAVVVVDMINWQAHPDGASIQALRAAGNEDLASFLLDRCQTVVTPALLRILERARRVGVRVVHARLASRSPDFADIVPGLRAYVRMARAAEGSWGSEPLEGLYQQGDISITKSGSGAFNSSDLNQVLRNLGIRTVIYAGVVTSACVLLTAAEGYDLGYRQYVLEDCTAATAEDDQEYAIRFMDTYVAQAVTAAETLTALGTVSH